MLESSSEIRTWLQQFTHPDRVTAENLLLKLKFVTWNVYSEWLRQTLSGLSADPCALYAVRKFDKNESRSLWDPSGDTIKRSISSQGSEDLVRSVISGLIKVNSKRFLDHPSLRDMRLRKASEIVLIDDSIGSGKRVSDFIEVMMENRTFRSWWSYGWIRLHIISFARTFEATKIIVDSTPGSDHACRKYPKSKKFQFTSPPPVYQISHLESRWGSRFQAIVDLCLSQKTIPASCRLGFRGTMANMIFYHSVPNNIPGLLWFRSEKWAPLFPGRTVPAWLPRLLEGASQIPTRGAKVSETLILTLQSIKRGVRNQHSLSRVVGVDIPVLKQLLASGRQSGFLTEGDRLTRAGAQVIWEANQRPGVDDFDRSLYVPKKWRVDRGTAQPFVPGGTSRWKSNRFRG